MNSALLLDIPDGYVMDSNEMPMIIMHYLHPPPFSLSLSLSLQKRPDEWPGVQLLQQYSSDHAQVCNLGLDIHSLEGAGAGGHGIHRAEKIPSPFPALVSHACMGIYIIDNKFSNV